MRKPSMQIHALIFDLECLPPASKQLIAWIDQHGNGKSSSAGSAGRDVRATRMVNRRPAVQHFLMGVTRDQDLAAVRVTAV